MPSSSPSHPAREIDFSTATAYPEFRQDYLDSLRPRCPPSVSHIVYDPESRILMRYLLSLCRTPEERAVTRSMDKGINAKFHRFLTVARSDRYADGRAHPIFASIFPFDFDQESELYSSLYDHECVHAQNMMHGIVLPGDLHIDGASAQRLRPDLLAQVSEIEAYRNQIVKAPMRGLEGSAFLETIKLECIITYDQFSKVVAQNPFEERVIDAAKTMREFDLLLCK